MPLCTCKNFDYSKYTEAFVSENFAQQLCAKKSRVSPFSSNEPSVLYAALRFFRFFFPEAYWIIRDKKITHHQKLVATACLVICIRHLTIGFCILGSTQLSEMKKYNFYSTPEISDKMATACLVICIRLKRSRGQQTVPKPSTFGNF